MFVQWRWYYNVPSLPLGVLLLLLIVVPQHNRNWRAWLILLLPLLAAVFSLLLQTLVVEADSFGQFVAALAVGWTSVWLLGPWLQGGSQLRRLCYVCTVMVAVGVVAYLGVFGVWVSLDVTLPMIGLWGVCSVSLIAAAALTGLCCRGNCSSLRLAFWPMLWLPVASLLCVGVAMTVMFVCFGIGGDLTLLDVAGALFAGFVVSLFLAGGLYVLDLPVLLLRIFSPCYRERFRGLFCPAVRRVPITTTLAELEKESVGTNPFRAVL